MSAKDDLDIIAEARAGFLDEAADHLRAFEQALLVLESEPKDAEQLNAAFRAAHTIKGTAGLFGFDDVVAFTHEVETLLEALRSGQLQLDDAITAGLLAGLDQMAALIDEVRTGSSEPAVRQQSLALGDHLRLLYTMGQAPVALAKSASSAPAPAQFDDLSRSAGLAAPPRGAWHISVRFQTDALRNGLDPLAFLRYLGKLGTITVCRTLEDAIPLLEALDAESCHLGFELQLQTEQSRKDIEAVFEFAADDCSLIILEPTAGASEWLALLDARAGADDALRSTLTALWVDMGASTGAQAAHAEAPRAPPVVEQPERRQKGTDRRESPADRRSEALDRRTGDRRGGAQPEEARFVKVRADKLDQLINLIGELVIAGSGAQMVAQQHGSAPFLEATQRVGELVQATRDGALALRMVPIAETFSRFQRVVRDSGKQLGKDIDFTMSGGDTELDKAMVDVIADPLMHLVRNSVDHGLELPEERLQAGKPSKGQLGLNAYHDGGSIVIEVSDDGRGLSRERILAKAVERGLVQPDTPLTDAEVHQLIFAPGFSTAERVTDLSGRGVGMDVVKRNVEALRGQISLASTEGRGTTTQIRLPLTLAMIDGFLTLVGGVHYVLPLAVVAECIDVPPECQKAPERACGTFDLRDEVLPYVDLARFYNAASPTERRRSLVVVRDGPSRIGLVVDRLLGEHQTVIKPLAGIFHDLKALAGTTILGSGEVALVLDVQALVLEATRDSAASRLRRSASTRPSTPLTHSGKTR